MHEHCLISNPSASLPFPIQDPINPPLFSLSHTLSLFVYVHVFSYGVFLYKRRWLVSHEGGHEARLGGRAKYGPN